MMGGPQARFASAYYVVNAALLASYTLVRVYHERADPSRRKYVKTEADLRTWEKQALFALVATLMFRLWRRRSWDHFAAQALFYCKFVLALTATMVDPRLLGWYCLAYWGAYALLPQPMVDISDSGDVQSLTPTTLKEFMLGTDCASMVFFYSPAQSTSVAAVPSFIDVAREYASSKLRFGTFDVSAWPAVAADAKVTSNTWSGALPAVALYEKGKEWGRLPPVGADATRANYFKATDVVRLFKLADRFTRPLDAPTIK